MATPTTFARQEVKFLMTDAQRIELDALMRMYMEPDSFGRSTIYNIYYDTSDSRLIRHSLERPVYKEKLRVRSYGTAGAEDTVYVELKKKYRGIVYKRRVAMSEQQARLWLAGGACPPEDSQIIREITHFQQVFDPLRAAVQLSYEREAFFGREDDGFRMTFDQNIRWRDYDLSLGKGAYGVQLLAPRTQLLEVKCALGIPLWLSRFFSEQQIYKTTYSKYGNAYLARREKIHCGGMQSA